MCWHELQQRAICGSSTSISRGKPKFLYYLGLDCYPFYFSYCYRNFWGERVVWSSVFFPVLPVVAVSKKGLNAHCVPTVITLKCCAGEGGEAIFSWPQLVISLSPGSVTVDIFGHFSLASVILDAILIRTNVWSSFCSLSWLCQRISELQRDEEQGRQCTDAVWLMLQAMHNSNCRFFLP